MFLLGLAAQTLDWTMRWTVLAAGLLAVLFVEPAAADTRVALVVGNSTYQNVSRLQNPKSDAELVAETLQRLGFALVGGQAQVDLDKTGFDAAIQRFTVQKPRLDVLQAFNQVGLVVKRATGSAQQPWVSTSPIDGSFYFAGNTPAQVATADPPATVIPPPPSSPPSAPPVVRTQSDFIIPDSTAACCRRAISGRSARTTCGSPAMKSSRGAAATSTRRT